MWLDAILNFFLKTFSKYGLNILYFVIITFIFNLVWSVISFIFYHYSVGLSLWFGAFVTSQTIRLLLHLFFFSWFIVVANFIYNLVKD